MNSTDSLPPIAPDDASTASVSSPQRSKILPVRVEVLLEGAVEARGRGVEGVGVLHHELAHAQEARLRALLVAELGLELVPDLRELLVGAQLAGEPGEDLLVGEAEAELRAVAVAQAEHRPRPRPPSARSSARARPAGARAARTPARRSCSSPGARCARSSRMLRTPERQQRVGARHQLADEAAAHEQAVARGLGVGRVVAKRRNEGACPAHGAPPETRGG